MKNEQSVSPQFLQFTALVIPNLPRNFKPDRLDHYIGPGRSDLHDKLHAAFADDLVQPGTESSTQSQVELEKPAMPVLHTLDTSQGLFSWFDAWKQFCKEFKLKVSVDFEALKEKALTRPTGFDWVVYAPTGFTQRDAIDLLCKPQFSVYESLPVQNYSLERQPDKPLLTLCRATIEPDAKWINKTADEMKATPVPFLDCRERYILEAFHYWLTKKHLDIRGWTCCVRSRTPDHRVADALWGEASSRFCAYWSGGGNRSLDTGGREAVILGA